MLTAAKAEYIAAGGTEESLPYGLGICGDETETETWLWRNAARLWRERAERAEKALKKAGIG